MTYDRELLMEVANLHHKVSIEGCVCGWSRLGATIGEHVADVYERLARERHPGFTIERDV